MSLYTNISYALLTILFVLFVVYNWKRRHLYILSYKLPGPTAYPIVGNIFNIGGTEDVIFENYVKLIASYKSNTRLWLGSELLIILKNVDDVERLLMSQTLTQKLKFYEFLKSSFGNGLIVSSDPVHRMSHRLILPTFHFEVIESYIKTFEENSEILVKNLRKFVGKGSFNIFKTAHLCAVKAVVETLLDVEVNTEISNKFLHAVTTFYDIFQERLYKPWLHFEFIFNLTRLSKLEKDTSKHFRKFIKNVIEAKKIEIINETKYPEYKANSKRTSTLEFLLRKIIENPKTMSEEQLISEISTLFLAAEDTTSTQYSFTILMLGMHPKIQAKVYAEIQNEIGSNTNFSPSDLNKLKYLEMVINESLRLLPIAPLHGRKVTEKFPFGNFFAPVGSLIGISVYEIHRDPIHWEKPNEFYPDHFTPDQIAKRHPYAFTPFSGGPRRCLGKAYAIYLLKTMIVNTLRNYSIEADGTLQDIRITGGVACRVFGGYSVRLNYRLGIL